MESYVFYRSFLTVIKKLNPEDAKNLIMALSEYALDGKEPKIDGSVELCFDLMKPQLDANSKRRKKKVEKKLAEKEMENEK